MRKVKHNKIRNTGLLFEFLLRQITADVLNSGKDSKAVSILTLAEGQYQDSQVVDKEINFMSTMIRLLGNIK